MTAPRPGALPKVDASLPHGTSAAADDALAGNEVQELYRRHAPRLVRQLTRATGCGETARDLMQETFVRLMRMNPMGLARIDQPEAFLRKVSVNLLRDHGRKRLHAERARRALAPPSEPVLNQVAVLETRETLRRLEHAMAKLKPRTRDIFLAHRLEGLSYAEIAERTGLSLKGVEKQMSRAIAKIDRMLDRA